MCPVVGLSVVRNARGAACVRNFMFSSPRGHVSRNSERTKLKRRLGIGKRVATCHLTAASETELKFIWSGNTWCFRDAVPSQAFSPGTSQSFCFLICVGKSCIVDCGCCAFARRKSCPGEHADVSYVCGRFQHQPIRRIASKRTEFRDQRPWTNSASKATALYYVSLLRLFFHMFSSRSAWLRHGRAGTIFFLRVSHVHARTL